MSTTILLKSFMAVGPDFTNGLSTNDKSKIKFK
jgi:hypothetical protein